MTCPSSSLSIRSRTNGGDEGQWRVGIKALEDPVDDANVEMGVLVEKGAKLMDEDHRADAGS